MISYSFSIATMALSLVVSEIFSDKQWRDPETGSMDRSRSLKLRRFIDHIRLSIGRPL